MKRILNAVVKILTNSLIISAICAVIAIFSPAGSLLRNVFGFVGFYGLIVTVYIFFASAILSILAIILKE